MSKGQAKGGEGGKNGGPAPIIIKKKKGGHGGHHGGAWKVAYADFVTAMMAFFLLLWLLNVTTSDQKQGIADYFSPVSVSRNPSGSGGMLGGRTLTAPGALLSASSPIAEQMAITGAPGAAASLPEDPDAEEPEEPDYQREKPGTDTSPGSAAAGKTPAQAQLLSQLQQVADAVGLPGDRPIASIEDFARRAAMMRPTYPEPRPDETRFEFQRRIEAEAIQQGVAGQKPAESLSQFAERVDESAAGPARGAEDRAAQQAERRQFQEAAAELRQEVQAASELKDVAGQVLVDEVPEGLRIQIIDQEQTVMFPTGSSQMFPRTRQLMQTVGRVIRDLPNRITISGHTDSRPFKVGAVRDNWDLSAERANASRRALIESGVAESRFVTVVGRSDRDPFLPEDPTSPRNRRISILIHRVSPPAGSK